MSERTGARRQVANSLRAAGDRTRRLAHQVGALGKDTLAATTSDDGRHEHTEPSDGHPRDLERESDVRGGSAPAATSQSRRRQTQHSPTALGFEALADAAVQIQRTALTSGSWRPPVDPASLAAKYPWLMTRSGAIGGLSPAEPLAEALAAAGLRRWEHLALCSLEELQRSGQFSPNHAAELLSFLANQPDAGILSAPVRLDLADAATFGQAVLGESTLGGLLSRVDELPDQHRAAIERAQDLELARLTSGLTIAGQLSDLVSRARYPETFRLRMLTTPQPTLEEVGAIVGDVTRERIRQRVSGDLKHISELAQSADFRLFSEYLDYLRSLFADVLPSSDDEVDRTLLLAASEDIAPSDARRLVLELAGLKESEGWIGRSRNSIDRHVTDLKAIVREIDIVEDSFDAIAAANNVSPVAVRDAAERGELGRWISDFCYVKWNGSAAEKAYTVLRLVLRPLTAEEIAEYCGDGTTVRNIGNQISQDRRFVRTDKSSRYGLSEWGVEEYSGIAEEIVQRVERGGGVASRASIVAEFTAQFGVSENSIDSNLRLPLFVVVGDEVRLGDPTRFDAVPPHTVTTAVRTAEGWGERFDVTVDALNGYSYTLNPHVGWANGIRPQDSLVVPIAGSNRTASVIWRVTNISGRIDIGHLSHVLKERDLVPGDSIVICPTRDHVFLFAGQEEIEETRRTAERQVVLPETTRRRLEALG